MTETFRKLNFKDQNPVLILAAPDSFRREIEAMAAFTTIHLEPLRSMKYGFGLAFAANKNELIEIGRKILPLMLEDAVLWFAYPKKTSPTMESDLSRDVCWEVLGALGLRANRQIAIDDDWSALRFKKE
jgi:hypothetical protein